MNQGDSQDDGTVLPTPEYTGNQGIGSTPIRTYEVQLPDQSGTNTAFSSLKSMRKPSLKKKQGPKDGEGNDMDGQHSCLEKSVTFAPSVQSGLKTISEAKCEESLHLCRLKLF